MRGTVIPAQEVNFDKNSRIFSATVHSMTKQFNKIVRLFIKLIIYIYIFLTSNKSFQISRRKKYQDVKIRSAFVVYCSLCHATCQNDEQTKARVSQWMSMHLRKYSRNENENVYKTYDVQGYAMLNR